MVQPDATKGTPPHLVVGPWARFSQTAPGADSRRWEGGKLGRGGGGANDSPNVFRSEKGRPQQVQQAEGPLPGGEGRESRGQARGQRLGGGPATWWGGHGKRSDGGPVSSKSRISP